MIRTYLHKRGENPSAAAHIYVAYIQKNPHYQKDYCSWANLA